MKLIKLAPEARVLTVTKGTILFSYETPIALTINGRRYLNVEYKNYSKTINKHIEMYKVSEYRYVEENEFNRLLEEMFA